MAEARITKQTKGLLDQYIKDGADLYYNKISDRYTSGMADIQGTFNSVPFYVELKDVGKEARKLQVWHLIRAKRAKAAVLSTGCFDEITVFFAKLNKFKLPRETEQLLNSL